MCFFAHRSMARAHGRRARGSRQSARCPLIAVCSSCRSRACQRWAMWTIALGSLTWVNNKETTPTSRSHCGSSKRWMSQPPGPGFKKYVIAGMAVLRAVHPSELGNCSCEWTTQPFVWVPEEEKPRCYECLKPVQDLSRLRSLDQAAARWRLFCLCLLDISPLQVQSPQPQSRSSRIATHGG